MEPFVSSVDLGHYLRQEIVDDEAAVIALNAACEVVRGYLQQTVNLVEGDEITLPGSGRETLVLPELPVVAVTDVTQVTLVESVVTETLMVEGTDYAVGTGGILWALGYEAVWTVDPYVRNNFIVTYDHGWSVTEPGSGDAFTGVPDDIRLIALELAAGVYVAGTVGVGGIKSETLGGYSYTLADATDTSAGLTASHARVLDRYRRRGVA